MSVAHETFTEPAGASDEALRRHALTRLKKRRDFKAHLLIYTPVNVVLWLLIAVITSNWFPWAALPTLGWGIGIAMHAWDVYGKRPITEADVQAEVERLRPTR